MDGLAPPLPTERPLPPIANRDPDTSADKFYSLQRTGYRRQLRIAIFGWIGLSRRCKYKIRETKISFDPCNSCKRLSLSHLTQNFRLFHISKSSVLNFRYSMLRFPGVSVVRLSHKHRSGRRTLQIPVNNTAPSARTFLRMTPLRALQHCHSPLSDSPPAAVRSPLGAGRSPDCPTQRGGSAGVCLRLSNTATRYEPLPAGTERRALVVREWDGESTSE